jgi:phosphatidylglycerol---prolipoprotein diacylglyceryl transferase
VQPGILFAIYLVLAGTERLLVEFIRRNTPELVGLTQPQLISVVMIAAGVVWLVLNARSGPLTKPAPPAASQTAAIRTTA